MLKDCPNCGKQDKFENIAKVRIEKYKIDGITNRELEHKVFIECVLCGKKTSPCFGFEDAEKEWNNDV